MRFGLVSRIACLTAFASVIAGSGCGDSSPDDGTVCTPRHEQSCYDGPDETEGIGACRAGVQTCSSDGESFGACRGQVTPVEEDCSTAVDDDCDGEVNEGCECVPGAVESCYEAPEETLGVGVCRAGTHTCKEDGSGFGACEGQIVPTDEDCTTSTDDDCDGVVNQPSACLCREGEVQPCYSGPDGTQGVGICVAGTQECLPGGGTFGPCMGEVLPQASEDCGTPLDDDCNGEVNEPAAQCTCNPGDTAPCYSGPSSTIGVGVCEAGSQTCDASGDGYGACEGDVTPTPEDCGTPDDENCNGEVNEESAGCECSPGDEEPCYDGPPFTLGVGTCAPGTRTCAASGQWGACVGEIVPIAEDCNTSFDENCNGAVNEPSAGCECGDEDPLSLPSEDCVLDAGETVFRKPIPKLPHEMAADDLGNAYVIMRRDGPIDDFEAVEAPLSGAALVGRYLPNGDLAWGKELTGAVYPQAGYGHAFDMSVSGNGLLALTAPADGAGTASFGAFDTYALTSAAFRVLYLIDPGGFPYYAIEVPHYSAQLESNISPHSISVAEDGSVFYVNGPVNSHLVKFNGFGEIEWDRPLGVDLDDMAVAATPDGGAVLALTTSSTIDLGTGPLSPISGSPNDLVIARFDSTGATMWTSRPKSSGGVYAARVEGGVIGVMEKTALSRFNLEDVTPLISDPPLSVDPLPSADVPNASFALVGVDAVVYTRADAPTQDFGLGDLDPFGGAPVGDFVALRSVGGTRWSRAPQVTGIVVGGGSPNIVLAAFSGEGMMNLDGTPIPAPQPIVYLTRLSY